MLETYTLRRSVVFLSIFISVAVISCNRLRFVSIGTGAVTGIYYPTGGAICRFLNKHRKFYQIKATVEATPGSVYNVNAVISGDLEFGIVQSDRQYQAYHGLSEWAGKGRQSELRSVFSIHAESVILVASTKSGIHSIYDLIGKRVNIGNPGSGPLQNARDALSAFHIQENDIIAEYVKAIEAPGLLQDERIDAFFYTVGHPSGNIKEATSGRLKVRFIPLQGSSIDQLIEGHPYYSYSEIPVHHYPGAQNRNNVPTFGVKGTLVTSTSTEADIVFALTKEILDNLDAFKQLHPAYRDLTLRSMLTGLTAPLHPGALTYFKQRGIESFIPGNLQTDNH